MTATASTKNSELSSSSAIAAPIADMPGLASLTAPVAQSSSSVQTLFPFAICAEAKLPNCTLDDLAKAAIRATIIKSDSVNMVNLGGGVKFGHYHSDNVTFAFWEFPPGLVIPRHSHGEEQVSTVMQGQLRITAGLQTYSLKAGSSIVIPANLEHEATSVGSTIVHDVFSPPRYDFDDTDRMKRIFSALDVAG